MLNVALIPARNGSKRLPGKNIKELKGRPLIAYTICSALSSGVFSDVIVSTNCPNIAEIAVRWGARVPLLRPEKFARDNSPDIEWVNHSVTHMLNQPLHDIGYFAILRPTNPLRSSSTIINAMETIQNTLWADSLRAMELCSQHPGKMWTLDHKSEATAFLPQDKHTVPTHSQPTQSLPAVWSQNASLEIVKSTSLLSTGLISGSRVLGFEMPSYEGFDINTETDWDYLNFLLWRNPELLREVS